MFEYTKVGITTASRIISNRIYAKWYILLSIYCITSYWLLCYLNRIQSSLYMDEGFHAGQLRKYCEGAFSKWDPKITTPPGLYIFTLIFTWPLSQLLGRPELCWDLSWLRGTVVLTSVLIPVLAASILRLLHGIKDERDATAHMITAFNLAIFPVLYFFNFLYYTDVLSTALVLCTFWLYLRDNNIMSAIIGLLSVTIRQTNIMWVALCAILAVFRTLRENAGRKFSPNVAVSSEYFALLWNHSVRPSLKSFSSFQKLVIILLRNVWAYVLVGALFIVFVIVNGGIVLGDKQAHVAVLHFPQALYFSAFTLIFTSPLMVSRLLNFFGLLKHRLTALVFSAILAAVMIHYFTMAHPYLLADNRHYTFYIWRRVIDRSWWSRYALIPVYIVGAFWIKDLLVDTNIAFRIIWAACTIVCVVPQCLLEFRYFIIPFVFLRLHYRRTGIPELLLEMIFYISVNAVTIYLFVTKKIHWANENDYQRVMW